jgi:hypothetical protein
LPKESVGGQKLEQQQRTYHFFQRLKTIYAAGFFILIPTEMCRIGQYLDSETEVPSYCVHLQDAK